MASSMNVQSKGAVEKQYIHKRLAKQRTEEFDDDPEEAVDAGADGSGE